MTDVPPTTVQATREASGRPQDGDRPATLRVLILIDGLGTGGAERSLAELLPHLAAGSGVEPLVACLHRRPEGVDRLIREDWDVRLLTGSGVVTRSLAARRLIEAEGPDVVHTTLAAASLVGRLAAIGGPPVLTTLVSTPYLKERVLDPRVTVAKLGLARALDGATSRLLTDRFHAISQTVRQHAIEQLRIPPDRIEVVYRGRDERRLGRPSPARRAAARRDLGIDDHDEVIVHLGRQEFPKGHEHLLDGFDALAARRPRARLLLAGRRGDRSPRIDQVHARMRHRDRVRFLGHRDDAPDVLAAGDVFAFPSLWEGLGCSLLEAMALGLPIVASDLPAIREVVEPDRSATLIPPGDAPALGEAMDAMLADPARMAAYGRHGRRIFHERFTMTASARGMIDLYRRTAQRSANLPAGTGSDRLAGPHAT